MRWGVLAALFVMMLGGCLWDRKDCVRDCQEVATGCPSLPENPAELFVNAGAPRGGNGTAQCPVRTVSEALETLRTSAAVARTIHVAAGVYDTTAGEKFPLVLSGGTTLIGAGRDKTFIRGVGDFKPISGTLQRTYQVTIATGIDNGYARVESVSVEPFAGALAPKVDHFGVFCNGGNSPLRGVPPPTLPTPNLEIADTRVGPGFNGGVIVTSTEKFGCNAAIVNSELFGNQLGAWSLTCGAFGGGGYHDSALTIGDGTQTGRVVFRKNTEAGLMVWCGTAALRVTHALFQENVIGARVLTTYYPTGTAPVPRAELDISDSIFEKNSTAGLYMGGTATLDALERNIFRENTNTAGSSRGVFLEANEARPRMPTILRARENSFLNNDVGVEIRSKNPLSSTYGSSDFGKVGSPGNNVFACNAARPGGGAGGDVIVDLNSEGPTLLFAGNQWDHNPPTQEKALTGTNGVDVLLRASPYPALDVSNAKAHGISCPADRPL
jgi:hypothetical protein